MAQDKEESITTVSAPGKILLAGGYLVLEAPNVGVVLAVDKKFYSTVKVVASSEKKAGGAIAVHSPQFGATWNYFLGGNSKSKDGAPGSSHWDLQADPANASSNSFVEKTLRITMAYLLFSATSDLWQKQDLEITILADNDFYSLTPHLQARQWDATPHFISQLPPFLPCQTSSSSSSDGGSLQKTGLGSSAALVTSLVGALVVSAAKTTTTTIINDVMRRKIHNLAQICHCHAQGKVGSGFDVSSASYGSHVYQRFPKDLLADLLQELDQQDNNNKSEDSSSSSSSSSSSNKIVETLRHLVEESPPETFQWPIVQKPLLWNTDLLQIMLADVSGGSESPSMARKILSWKVASSDISCWTNLLALNQRVVDLSEDIVQSLEGCTANRIADMAQRFSQSKLDDKTALWATSHETKDDQVTRKVGRLLCELRGTLLETRKNLKTMGDLAQVPVEPDEQTHLANATMELPGVVASLVPGAGGYDALVVVYVNTTQVRDQICQLWTNYKPLAVCPLAVQFAPYGDGLTLQSETPQYNTAV